MRDKDIGRVAVGDRVSWRREQRGGYGFVEHIPGVVLALTPRKARIRVALRDGTAVERHVDPASLRPRDYAFEPLGEHPND